MEITIAHSSSVSSSNATLLVALELSTATWVVALSAPFSDRISHHSIAGGDASALLKLIGQARSRAEAALGQSVRVVCCYEAGYDGFWLHRVLIAHDIDNHVLDAASLLVNRRARPGQDRSHRCRRIDPSPGSPDARRAPRVPCCALSAYCIYGRLEDVALIRVADGRNKHQESDAACRLGR